MERTDAQSLGDLLRLEIEQNQARYRYDEMNAIKLWPVVVGEKIAAQTMRPQINKGVMTIRVPGAALRQELNMMRAAIAKAINAETGKDVIKELRFIG